MADHKRAEGARTKEATQGTVANTGPVKVGGEWKFSAKPQFLADRLKVWDELFEKQKAVYDGFPKEPIKVTMPDGTVKEGKSFETSPYDIAASISKQFADKIVVAKVKYTKRVATLDEGLLNPEAEEGKDAQDQWFFWDMNRKLEGDCELVLYKFEQEEGKQTFWHSSAHILGETLENEYGVQLCHGPPTEAGFFYDSYTGKDMFTEGNYKKIEEVAKKIVAEKQTFHRLVLTKEESLQLFGNNPFKVQLITAKIPEGGKVTAYRCGNLIDLCTGPHIPSTKIIKAFKVTKNSSAYWLGKAENDSLQRVYGITFPSKKEMDEWVHIQEEAAKRDHRNIGRQQDLFDMHQLSPGCAFMYPKGTWIYNNLVAMIKEQYRVRGYSEVISPNVFNLKLWKTSGHYLNYKDNIFIFKVENQGFGMKPMNCPGHCLMFGNTQRTYRELPLRYADFGVLHRNELSGALSGLTRVRRFCQDDAHHFCEEDNIMDEVMTVLDFLEHIYGIFGFKFELELSTRPEKRLGDEALWDKAEAALEAALNKFGKPWQLNAGDGAFYGPKIDVKVYDALKRAHQCGTVQLDFQLPIRFNLQYKTDAKTDGQKAGGEEEKKPLATQLFKKDEYDNEDFEWKEQPLRPGFARPVMIHRAVLGSVERFMAILIEHLGGKWPFFMSPRQIMVVPITAKYTAYCQSVYLYLHKQGYQVDCDFGTDTLNKKVRNGQLAQYNYIICAGEKEAAVGTVDIRTRENKRMGTMRLDEFHEHLQATEMPGKSKVYEEFYAKAWDPATFKVGTCADAHAGPKPAGGNLKVNTDSVFNPMYQALMAVADMTNFKVETNVTEDKSKDAFKSSVYATLADGAIISDTLAIMRHMVGSGGLLGANPMEEARITQWVSWCQEKWLSSSAKTLGSLYAGKADAKQFASDVKELQGLAKQLDKQISGKKWVAGDSMTLADVYLGACFKEAFQTLFDAGFRKGIPNLTKWFESFAKDKKVAKRFGNIKCCAQALKLAGEGGQKGGAGKKEAPKKAAKKDDDMDDLFGDDSDDGAAAAAAAAAKAKAQAGKKPKKAVIAQSLVLFEVKPLDDTTDIDQMAKDILAIKMDGLYWKTEYKKEPVAFGIFKIIIGVTVEDEKVSVDGLQEQIEAIEDKVQSVEILAFNKI